MAEGDWHGYEADCVFDCGHINRSIIICIEDNRERGKFEGIQENQENEICKTCGYRTKSMSWNAPSYWKYLGRLDNGPKLAERIV